MLTVKIVSDNRDGKKLMVSRIMAKISTFITPLSMA